MVENIHDINDFQKLNDMVRILFCSGILKAKGTFPILSFFALFLNISEEKSNKYYKYKFAKLQKS